MGVDRVGRAGQQGEQVAVLLDVQVLGVIGQDDLDLIDLVLQGLVEDVDEEHVALLEIGQVVEKGLGGIGGVRRDNAVGVFAADGERGIFQMTRAL